MARGTAVRAAGLIGLALVAAGCRSQVAMEGAARSAATQLVTLQSEIQSKIQAENAYYDQSLEDLVEAVARTRSIEVEALLEEEAQGFAQGTTRPSPGELRQFLTGFVAAWQKAEAARQEVLAEVAQDLASARLKLAQDAAKLNTLQNQLRVLAEARSRKQLARFLFEFAGQVYTDYEQARQAPPPPPP